jgi:hypothetical protein
MTDRNNWRRQHNEVHERERHGARPENDPWEDQWAGDAREYRYADTRGEPRFRNERDWNDDTDREADRGAGEGSSRRSIGYDARPFGEGRREPRHRRHSEGDLPGPNRNSTWPFMSTAEEQFYGGFGGDPERNRQLAGQRFRDERSNRTGLRDQDSRERHGVFNRARDEVASWISGNEAASQSEKHHRGRGPAGYTRSDERISEDVHERLTDDAGVDASGITVSVENCEVTLNGLVPTRYQKRRAEDCVEDVSGVRHVQNNLRVQESG